MSPEQARGKTVDQRADIWAFGCVVYESLTGKRTFQGESLTDILAAIVTTDPDWASMPPDTPRLVTSVLRRCLQKDPNRRLHDIADARLEIQEAMLRPTPRTCQDDGVQARSAALFPGSSRRFLSGAIRDVSLVSPVPPCRLRP